MADRAPKGDWRQQGKKAAPTVPAQAAGAGKRDWQRQAVPEAGPRKPVSRGSKLFFALMLLGILGSGVYLAILLLRPIRPACLVLIGSSYFDNLAVPANLCGWNGLVDLGKLTDQSTFSKSGKPNLAFGPHPLKGENAFDKEWPKFNKNFRESTVVFFIALHGDTERKEPFFYVDDERGKERLPFKHLLKFLSGPELAEKKIVLMLEPVQATSNWATGMLQNDFVKRLKELEPEIEKQRNLLVVCACDADQKSWESLEWRQTVFQHYIIEGLQGAADADGNERVTAWELFQYVQNKVQAWAQSNRGVEQTPILLGGGKERAETIDMAQVSQTYKERAPDEAPGKAFEFTPKLEEAWRAYRELGKLAPHPSVYTPHLWRRYQDMLLRFEQIMSYDSTDARADELLGKLQALEKAIRTQAKFEQASPVVMRALPMADVLGMAPTLEESDLGDRLKSIWNAAKDEKRTEEVASLDAWAKKQDDANRSLFRVQLYRGYLNFLINNAIVRDDELIRKDGEDKSKALAILELLETKFGPPRPAELHYLTMLLTDVSRSPTPPIDLLKQSLTVRMTAERIALAVPRQERTATYSEVVLPWIQEKLMRAEAWRRPGEDRLFASDATTWEQGRKSLDKALSLYNEIQAETTIYRTALATRDKALAELPDFAHWVAAQRYTTSKDRESAVAGWISQVQGFAEQVRELKLALDQARPQVPQLAKLTESVKSEQDRLHLALENEAGEYAEQVDLHRNWHVRDALLSIPLLTEPQGEDGVVMRRKLLTANRKTSLKFHAGTSDKTLAAEDRGSKAAEEGARRNRVMALATYKLFWQNDLVAVEAEPTQRIGETLGDLQSRCPKVINDAVRESTREPDIKKAATNLREAEYLAHGISGAMAKFLDNDPYPVTEAARRLRLHDLLLSQARRTILDHWYAEPQSTSVTYYEPAANDYLKVAQALVEAGTEGGEDMKKLRRAAVVSMRDVLREVGLDIDPNASNYWTSEKEFPITWTVKAPREEYLKANSGEEAKNPPGIAMVWRELEGPASWVDQPKPGQRDVIDLYTNESETFPRRYKLVKADVKNDDPNVRIRAGYKVLFRGQRLSSLMDIAPQPPDVIVHRFPPADEGRMSVRMDKDFTYGAIAICLDISGSMVWKKGYAIEGQPRIEHAIKALDQTLKQVPENTYVSLHAFITKRGKYKPETIRLVPSDNWRQENREALLRSIRELADMAWKEDDEGATGPSPIASTIVEAYRNGFPEANRNFRGPRVLLALTDGDDNFTGELVGNGKWPNPDQQPDAYAKQVRNYVFNAIGATDVQLHFACFNYKNDAEAQRATKQFKDLVEQEMRVPGQFFVTPEPAELAKELEKALQPRLIVLQGSTPPRGFKDDGMPVSLFHSERDWERLPPGQYTVHVKRSESREMKLDAGEMIAITLKRDPVDGKKVIYERELFAEVTKARTVLPEEAKQAKGRIAAILENNFELRTNKLRELISLEETSRGGRLQQVLPAFVWIEAKSKADEQPRLVRWYREYGSPAPTFRLIADNWPVVQARAAPAQVQMWWTDFPESPDISRQFSRSMKKKEPDKLRLGDDTVEIEDVSIEEKEVPTDAVGKDVGKMILKQCLVVRLSHTKGKPVLVQLASRHKGAEHRFYQGANKYTALFWDLDNPDQDQHLFNVIFLDAMKKQDEPVNFFVQKTTR
jgi:hypothetical protein